MKTKTIFRVWKAEPKTIIALFPNDPGTNDPRTCSSYEHVGQHGAADYAGVIRATRPLLPFEPNPLVRELRGIGYDLHICQRK